MGQRSVRFPDELEAAAARMANEHERPFSWIVVKALEAFVPETYFSVPFAGHPPQVDGLVKREQRAAKKAEPPAFDARAAALERQRRLNEGKS